MIVCSCNVFTDDDVRSAIAAAIAPVRATGEVYTCLGCSPRCGRCARTIKEIPADAVSCARIARGTAPAGCLHEPRLATRSAYRALRFRYDQYSSLTS